MSIIKEWLAQPQAQVFVNDLKGSEDKLRSASNNHLRRGETGPAAYNLGMAEGVRLVLDHIAHTRSGD